MSKESLKLIPCAPELEKALIGFIIQETDGTDLLSKLSIDDFQIQEHRMLFQLLNNLYHEGVPIDLITVFERLSLHHESDPSSIKELLFNMVDASPVTLNIDGYIKILQEKKFQRQLIVKCRQLIAKAQSSECQGPELAAELERDFFELSLNLEDEGLKMMGQIVHDAIENIENELQADQRNHILSGYHDLDQIVGGFRPGELSILAARPAVGKSALALNLALNAAIQKKRVAIFSLEMSEDDIAQRLFASHARLNSSRLRRGELSDDELDRLMGAARNLSELDRYLAIDDTAGLSLSQLRSRCRKHKKKNGLDLIMIDYLQLMRPSAGIKYDSEVHIISENSKGLKILAKELEVPILALAQVNRQSEQRMTDKRPKVSDLKGSGSIEQDADLVMLLYRDDVANRESVDQGVAELIIGKNRHGSTGIVRLAYHADTVTFHSLAKSS